MYGENRFADIVRVLHAISSNQIARLAPRLYVRITGETGRGGGKESVQQIADYFHGCFLDYFKALGVNQEHITEYLTGKRILEYGPGDVPGVGLLMLAYGAESMICVDQFPLYSLSPTAIEVMRRLMDRLDGDVRSRAESCFVQNGNPASGFLEQRLRYVIHPYGLSGLTEVADLIISKAVLEHVRDLSATFSDMSRALCRTGVAVHEIDLRSHGLHSQNPLDFLTWPPYLWSWMYCYKGYINRWRVDRYRQTASESDLAIEMIRPVKLANEDDIKEVRSRLAIPFRQLSDEDLSWLGIWLVCRRSSRNDVKKKDFFGDA